MEYEMGTKLDTIIEQNNQIIQMFNLILEKYRPELFKKEEEGRGR